VQIDPEKVENLVFEGGGGKGVVYLGVVKALESQKLLPIQLEKNTVSRDLLPYHLVDEEKKANKIKRISGSSAGAITSFMLSMGCGSEDIVNELKDPQQFLEFFDLPKQVSRNHRDGTTDARSKQTIREVAYQSSEANRLKKDHKHTSPLKGTEIEVTDKWRIQQDPFKIPSLVLSFFKYFFSLDKKIAESNILSSIMNRTIGDDEWANYMRMRYVPVFTTQGTISKEKESAALTKLAIEADFVSHLQLTGGFFPGRQVRFFFHRLLFRYLYKIDDDIIDLMLQQYPRTNGEEANRSDGRNSNERKMVKDYIDQNFANARTNARIERFMKLKEGVQVKTLDEFIDLLANINFREFFYITGVDLSLTGTNVTRMAPRIFSHAYTPLMPVCEAVAISMNIPLLFSPVIVRGNVMDEAQYQALLNYSEVPKEIKTRWPYSKYNEHYKGAYADGGMINNYPIQLVRNESRYAFQEFILPEKRFRRSGNKSINRSLGFRLTEWDGFADTDESDELQNHLSLLPYLNSVISSLQFFSEAGQLIDQDEQDVTVDIYVGKIGMLDFTPNRADATLPVMRAFWDTINKLKGILKMESEEAYALGRELKSDTEELTRLLNLLPQSKESVSRGY
jgi:predicted acylesterase/phospholipase RssA